MNYLKTKGVSNSNMRHYVAAYKSFENHKGTCFGYTTTKFIYEPVTGQLSHTETVGYVVYSYGAHFPIYFWDRALNQWIGNKDKYSRTTSRHQSQAMPVAREQIQWVDTDTLKAIVKNGYVGYVAERMK